MDRCVRLADPLSPLTTADQRGNTVCLGFAVGAIVISGILTTRNVLENRRRDRQFGKVSPADSTLENLVKPEALKRFNMEGKSREEVLSLGDRHRARMQPLASADSAQPRSATSSDRLVNC